jgi:DsbC/DsbD-like thiol-disulfide interchange protein
MNKKSNFLGVCHSFCIPKQKKLKYFENKKEHENLQINIQETVAKVLEISLRIVHKYKIEKG